MVASREGILYFARYFKSEPADLVIYCVILCSTPNSPQKIKMIISRSCVMNEVMLVNYHMKFVLKAPDGIPLPCYRRDIMHSTNHNAIEIRIGV